MKPATTPLYRFRLGNQEKWYYLRLTEREKDFINKTFNTLYSKGKIMLEIDYLEKVEEQNTISANYLKTGKNDLVSKNFEDVCIEIKKLLEKQDV